MKRIKLSEVKWYMLRAMAIFTACIVTIIAIYVFRDKTIHLNDSISFYMGRETWSAIIFGVCNIAVAYNWWQYIKGAEGRYNKRWLAWGALIVATFLGLSICPYMLFGEGVVSTMHQIFSRIMFVSMGMMVFEDILVSSGWRKIVMMLFLAFGLILIAMSMMTQVFWDLAIILEAMWIYGYMLMLVIAVG